MGQIAYQIGKKLPVCLVPLLFQPARESLDNHQSPVGQEGQGVAVMANVAINPDTYVGDHAIINTGATVDHDCHIARFAHIAPGVHLTGEVTVREGTLVGAGVATIPGVTIGKWCVIGTGAVVTKDVPDSVIAKGVPARWPTAGDKG